MTSLRTDPELGRASLPGAPAPFGTLEAPVALAAPASPAAVLLEGARVALLGTERRGVTTFVVDGVRVATDLEADAGTAANIIVAPATLRRERVGHAGSVFESALALPALPLGVVQWTGVRGTLHVEITLLPGAADVRYRSHEQGVRAAGSEADHQVDLLIHPAPAECAVRAAEGGGIRVHAAVAAEGPVTLMVAAGTEEAVSRALAAAPYLGSHEIRAAATGDPAKSHTLVVRTGVREIDHAITWATARIQAAVRRPGPASPESLFWTGMGALAAGDADSAKLALDAMPRVDALAALLAARYALATDDQDPAVTRFEAMDPPTLEAFRAQGRQAWSPWQDALPRLADALRNAVHESELNGLRSLASQPAADEGRVMRLPMAGAVPASDATWPGRLVAGREGAVPAGDPPAALAPWAALVSGRVDEAWAAWRRSLAEALVGGAAGRGSWDAVPDPWGPGAPGAGIAMATLAFGVLGIDADAPSGRLTLSPALPAHVRSFEAHGIRVGDASISMIYERVEGTHRFRLEPLGGRVPVMAILAPSVAVTDVGGIRVDGESVDLETVVEGGRTRVQVQLPLDAVRTLEVLAG